MKITFEYSEKTKAWECNVDGTVYRGDTFLDLATVVNAVLWENA